MRVHIATAEEFAARAADVVRGVVIKKPRAVLGIATGRTPIGMYAELTRRAAAGGVYFEHVTAFAVDELYGVPTQHPATNASYLAKHAPAPMRVRVMESNAPDADAECARFAEAIEKADGLDMVILGIGVNGHLAFNEPGSPFESRARPVRLERSTREAYVEAFGSLEATPEYGLTLGMQELLSAREVLLLADGATKASIVARALEGPLTEDVPASALQRHANVTVVLDEGAAGLLRQTTS
jgi:glucosamine-6-phosphate deaminase